MSFPSLARRAPARPLGAAPTHPDSIAFDSGHAFPGVLPDLTAEATRALTEFRSETLQYAPRPGLTPLREWIAEYLTADGTKAAPGDILVTNGAKHAIELICKLLLDEGDTIVVTVPTYFTAIPIFRSFGVGFHEVAQDAEGLDVEQLATLIETLEQKGERLPKFIYNVPDFHNPTGVTMSLARRQALVELAARKGIYILEDSPYRKVRFEGADVPSVKALDPGGLVFQCGTFSKLMAPGLRVGWVATTPDMVGRLIQLKADGGSCPLTQRIIHEFCRSGRLEAHTSRIQEIYRRNRDHMVAALRRDLPAARFAVPEGGYYVWLTLPEDVDGDEVATRAAAGGATVIPGSKFLAQPEAGHPRNTVRVAFSHATPEEIDEGIRRLAAAFDAVVSGAAALATPTGSQSR